jgi:hypothetical protein
VKALDWLRFLEMQQRQQGKLFFRVAELSNVARRAPHAINVELGRLIARGVIVRYATGVYGLPNHNEPEQLAAVLDEGAYITGAYALYRHNGITQAPTEITCFTNRRHNRSRRRITPLGKFVFVRVVPAIYCKPAGNAIAGPEQALCDFVRMCLRQGIDPASLVTFSRLSALSRRRLSAILKRYPARTAETVRKIAGVEE